MLLLLLACVGTKDTTDSTPALATATPSCAPWDGTAYAFTLPITGAAECTVTPTTPWVRIEVYDTAQVPLSAGDSYTLDNTGTTGAGWSYPTGDLGSAVLATSGNLTIDAWTEGSGGSGSWSLTLEDGSTLEGSFDATWCPADILCG